MLFIVAFELLLIAAMPRRLIALLPLLRLCAITLFAITTSLPR